MPAAMRSRNALQFADGFSWGSVRLADIHIVGEQASSVPIQIIADPAFPTIPASCSNSGPPENTVPSLRGQRSAGRRLVRAGLRQRVRPGRHSRNLLHVPRNWLSVPTQVPLAKQLQNPVATVQRGQQRRDPAVADGPGSGCRHGERLADLRHRNPDATTGLAAPRC